MPDDNAFKHAAVLQRFMKFKAAGSLEQIFDVLLEDAAPEIQSSAACSLSFCHTTCSPVDLCRSFTDGFSPLVHVLQDLQIGQIFVPGCGALVLHQMFAGDKPDRKTIQQAGFPGRPCFGETHSINLGNNINSIRRQSQHQDFFQKK